MHGGVLMQLLLLHQLFLINHSFDTITLHAQLTERCCAQWLLWWSY